MICPVCLCRWAEFSPEDYILDVPAPPGEGIIARSEMSHPRRMVEFHKDDIKYCGCAHDDENETEIISTCFERINIRQFEGETILQILADPCGDKRLRRRMWNMQRAKDKKVYDPLSPSDPLSPPDPICPILE